MSHGRIALRRLGKTPLFSSLTVITLALGLGAATVAFTLVQSVLLEPLPYHEPEDLVRVLALDRSEGQLEWLSWAEAVALHRGSRTLTDVAVSTVFPASLRTEEGNERVQRGFVSFDYFALLGVEPLLGNLFLEGDERQVLVGERLWRRRWSATPELVGRSLELDGELYVVAGILPDTVYTHDLGSSEAELWLPRSLDRVAGDPHFRIYTVLARRRPGATLDRIREELSVMQSRLAEETPSVYRGWEGQVDPLRASVVGESERGLLLLFASVCALLLIVSLNLANLMTSRFAARRREIATRLALGDRASGILRDAVLEGGLLAFLGGGLGVLLAAATLRALPGILPFPLPRQAEIEAGIGTFAVGMVLAAAVTLLFAVLPALGMRAGRLATSLRDTGRTVSGLGAGTRLRRWGIGAQVALSIPLMVGAGLLTESLERLGDRSLGMQPDGLVNLRISLPGEQYPDPEDRVSFFRELLDALETFPGVQDAGATLQVPFVATQADRAGFHFPENERISATERPRALLQVVTEGYFETLGTRLVEGRLFDARDQSRSMPVAIVSQALARRSLGGRSPLGLEIETDMTMTPGEPPRRRIIGVVQDIPHFGPRLEAEPQIFIPHSQSAFSSMGVLLRTRLPAEEVATRARALAVGLEPRVVLGEMVTLRSALDVTLGQPRFYSRLLLVFATAATFLACLGLYGLLTIAVTARSRELGIRAALGATPASLVALVIRHGLALILGGILLGLLMSTATVRLLQSLLFGVSPFDLTAFGGAGLALLVVSLVAAYLPARRAAALDPVEAIRTLD